MRTDIKLTSVDYQGKKSTTSITHANPEASNYAMRTLAQKLNDLTTNTYSSASRVDTTDLANAQPVTPKQDATITLAKTTMTAAEVKAAASSGTLTTFTYNGDASGFYLMQPLQTNVSTGFKPQERNGAKEIYIFTASAADPLAYFTLPFTLTLVAPETDNYKSAQATLTITA